MPIDIDRFEDSETLDTQSTRERILRFLLANDGQAYTRGEIADELEAKPETVGTNLTRLKDRGLVRHHQPYWAIVEDRERAIAALDDERSTRSRPHQEAATAFFDRVREQLDDSVKALYLFGSVARGTETETSDVDVLAVIEDDVDVASVDDRLLDIAYDVQLEYGVPVEVHSIETEEFTDRRERGEPFVRSVVEEGSSSA